MSWTDERVETLKRMWAEGQSASQIAKELGGVTRNAVIGKVHRLGLSNRVEGEEQPAPLAGQAAGPIPSAAAEPDSIPGEAAMAGDPSAPLGAAPGAAAESARPAAAAADVPGDTAAAPLPGEGVAASTLPEEAAAQARPGPAASPDEAEPDPMDEEEAPAPQPVFSPRRPIVPAGQPLPPQPSANEISPEALASVREVEKRARKLTLMELTERTCKWPIGDPATDKFWFCGLPAQPGKPYCEAHVGVAFQPMSARRDRRR
ncbi:GcrA family cell cycle regulator [Paracoccus contaminans]|uniref:GcrA cell cycle regulator n=2 Tax=Paracoccaceae TaxID=31989 RepID=A0A1W6CX19_9RHOB|nr:GcrA family cell cycle regulator [Paracoccus contaminans]ARJ69396.1 GcrA cell cycle regulator [Paracoccus contaminans]